MASWDGGSCGMLPDLQILSRIPRLAERVLAALAVPPESMCLGEASSTTPASPSIAHTQNGTACQGQPTSRGQCWAPSLTLTTIKDIEEPRLQVCKTLGGWDAGPLPPSSVGTAGLPCSSRPRRRQVCPTRQSVLSRFGGEECHKPTHCCPRGRTSHRCAGITSLSLPDLVSLCAAEIHLPVTSQCGPPAPAKWSWKWPALAGKRKAPQAQSAHPAGLTQPALGLCRRQPEDGAATPRVPCCPSSELLSHSAPREGA